MVASVALFFPGLVWTLFSGVVLTVGDIILRSWIETKWAHGFELAFLVYVFGVFCMMMSFFHQNIAVGTVAAVVLNAVLYLVAAHFFFGDTIGAWQITGIVLGIIAFAILEFA
jgi:drug/metabolite transporter (DMT)-like permease